MTHLRSPLACFHASNALTYFSLSGGVAAIAAAARGQAGLAGGLIAFAVILDSFDGRFARVFARSDEQRAMGGQLDSLADAVSFGLAPAICMSLLSGTAVQPLWWASVVLYVSSAISRLAFYNVTSERTDGFIGLPVPVAALVWATILLLKPGIGTSAAVFTLTAAAMVSPLRIPRPRGLSFAAFVSWPVLVIAAHVVRSP